MKTWIFQDPNMLKKHGPEKASWIVGYYGPDGRRKSKSCGRGSLGKKTAKALADKIHSQLTTGTYVEVNRTLWADFRKEYEGKVLSSKAANTQVAAAISMNHFERICKPVKMSAITSQMLASFVAARRNDRGLHAGSKASPASINKDLRHLKAALHKACRWSYLERMPEIDFEKKFEKLPTFVSAEQFAKIYHAVEVAKWPSVPNVTPSEWWKGLLMFAYTTGWRIRSILALRWSDVDLDAGTAISRADDNKGKRDQRITLPSVTVEHLRKLRSFNELVFPWDKAERRLWEQFARIQDAAGVKPDAKDAFGFHDLRRAFATLNADRLSPLELQAVMQHQSFETTKGYIAVAHKINQAGSKVFVPDLTRKAETG